MRELLKEVRFTMSGKRALAVRDVVRWYLKRNGYHGLMGNKMFGVLCRCDSRNLFNSVYCQPNECEVVRKVPCKDGDEECSQCSLLKSTVKGYCYVLKDTLGI